MSKEIWKKIEGFEDYSVSNHGRVSNDKRNRVLKGHVHYSGYNRTALYKNKVMFQKRVHRLVAIAFIPNPENKPIINHKDGNKLNNHVNNLEWVTHKENILHAYRELGIKTRSCPVIQYSKDGKFIAEYDSHTEAVRNNNFSNTKVSIKSKIGNIHKCIIGRKKNSLRVYLEI